MKSIIDEIHINQKKEHFPQEKSLVVEVDVNTTAIFEFDGIAYTIEVKLNDEEKAVLQSLWDRLERSYKIP